MTEKNKIEKIFDFLEISEKLKKTKRWENTPSMTFKETSADHSWHLGILLLVITSEFDYKIDVLRALKMALVHDLVEAIAGDTDASLIHFGKKTQEAKSEAELSAMKEIRASLPDRSGREIDNLWTEYEEGETREAKFVKALDKIEGINHMLFETHQSFDTPELIAPYPNESVKKFNSLKPILKELHKRLKPEYRKKKWEWKKEYDLS